MFTNHHNTAVMYTNDSLLKAFTQFVQSALAFSFLFGTLMVGSFNSLFFLYVVSYMDRVYNKPRRTMVFGLNLL